MNENENILAKMKNFADTSLTSFGMMPPDKMSSVIKELISKVSTLEKKVERLENNQKVKKRNKKNINNNDLDDFDSLD